MFPFYSGNDIHLTGDDRAAICYLYPDCEREGCAEGFECTSRGCVPTHDDSAQGNCTDSTGAAGAGACGELLEFGQPCGESKQCGGGECLTGARDEPVCTRRCDSLEQDCPQGWWCTEVLDRTVCAPLRAASGESCTLVSVSRDDQGPLAVWGLPGLLLGGAALRRRRTNRPKCEEGMRHEARL
jgi:MYXO-CTERM domain-containing protein